MRRLLPILLFILFGNLYAQTEVQIIEGQLIIDEEFPKDYNVDGIIINNLQRNESAVSSISGQFKIKASIGDSLSVVSATFKDRKLKVSNRIYEKKKVVIHLNEDAVELDAVTILPFDYTGYLEDDIQRVANMKDTITDLYKSLGINPKIRDLKPQENIEKLNFMEVFPLTADLGRISQALSGDLRRKRNAREYFALDEKLNWIQSYYSVEYFTVDLGIPEEQIRQFVVYCYYKDELEEAYNFKRIIEINESLENRKGEFIELLKSEGLFNNSSESNSKE